MSGLEERTTPLLSVAALAVMGPALTFIEATS